MNYIINLVVNQSISCAEHVKLIFYKVGQSLLQTSQRITECGNFITKLGKHNYEVAQLRIIIKGKRYYKVEQLIHYNVGQLLLHRGSCITKRSALLQIGTGITNRGKSYYKVGQVIYYKVGQSLLQSGVGIIKWGNYYRKGQYIFVTLGQIENHVYGQGQCGLRT